MWKPPVVSLLALAMGLVAGCGGSSEPMLPDGTEIPRDPGSPVASLPGSAPGAPAPAPAPPQSEFSRVWHVSPAGNDTADGSATAPFRTISKAVSVVGPGEAVLVKAGTYAETLVLEDRAGTAEAPITVRGEGMPKIVPSGRPGGMVQFHQPHWVVEDLELDVRGQSVFAVTFQGDVSGSILRRNDIHHGTLGAGVTTFGSARGATIAENDIHHFWRDSVDSHGVLVQPTSREIAIRDNTIHHNSGDSVQCIGPEGYSSNAPADGVVIEGNDLHHSGENAVDIKTCHNVAIRGNRMYALRLAPSNQGARGDALVIHMSARSVIVEDNDISDCGKGIALGGNRSGPMPSGVVIRRNRIHDILAAGGMEGTGIRVENSEGAVIVHNTLTRIGGQALWVGGGTGGPTSNLSVRNNIIDAALALHLGSQAPGLTMSSNLYPPGAVFTMDRVAESFDTWRATGQDSLSLQGDPAFSSLTALVPGPIAVDRGEDVGLKFCGAAPDLGAVETGC